MEPRVSGLKADNFVKKSGFELSFRVEASGFSGAIWIMWRNSVKIDVVVVSNQFVHDHCLDLVSRHSFFITLVYTSPNTLRRRTIWDQVRALEPELNSHWVLVGDFNVICNSSERMGGSHNRTEICSRFRDFLFNSGLLDMGFNGPQFTWKWGSLFQRLDRCLCNKEWYDFFAMSEAFHLQKLGSDDRPILLVSEPNKRGNVAHPFRYIDAWNDHPGFHNLVPDSWCKEKSMYDNIRNLQRNSEY
ncbi:uncharacterized protein LOC120210300 [Hibiscus syriacus]|uniref:uncharacterized protein LOC120210300 n=1 Tax=Hibiscus syriacus TaxID=106335 RepID=UPI0019235674|nr:uncharacterized protein LOC120210300 [Hibiscus syriacus]